MSTLTKDSVAVRVWFAEDSIWLRLDDGRQVGVPLAFYPRLLAATPEQRNAFEMSGGGRGLHWEALDEDLSVEGLAQGIPDRSKRRPL
jgi:hypothetical protein